MFRVVGRGGRSQQQPDQYRPWQDVLAELAGRLKFPAFTQPDGEKSSRATPI
jgi:hypothetical protein